MIVQHVKENIKSEATILMHFPSVFIDKEAALNLKDFKQMDYYAIEKYKLPIELMMENAGLQLANCIAHHADVNQSISIGIGNGNNGGGGLVAARRLAAWGYQVSLDLMEKITQQLPALQLSRALAFGASTQPLTKPHIWVDAYFGFSQRFPIPQDLTTKIESINSSDGLQISLDLPTGFNGDLSDTYFKADKVLTLAYPKKVLFDLPKSTDLYLADLGIPKSVYKKFNVEHPPFNQGNILTISK